MEVNTDMSHAIPLKFTDDEPSRNNVSLDQPASSKPVAAHVTGQVANPGKRKRNRKSRKSESTGADADPSVAAQNQDPSQRDQKKKERRLNHQQQQKTLLRLSGPGTLLTDNGTMTKRELEATRSQFSKQKTHASREMKLSKLKTQECSFWKQGLCTQGDQCTYSHDCPGSDPRSKQLCRFVKSGGCIAGSTCPYSHDLKISPCVFFHMKGGCRAGASCPFSHAPITQEQRAMMEYEQKGFASYASKRNQIYSTSIKAPTPGDPIHSSSLNELGKIDP